MDQIFETDLIENYLKLKNLTIKEFCKKCKIKKSELKKFMNNNANLKVKQLIKISKLIDVYVGNIFYINLPEEIDEDKYFYL